MYYLISQLFDTNTLYFLNHSNEYIMRNKMEFIWKGVRVNFDIEEDQRKRNDQVPYKVHDVWVNKNYILNICSKKSLQTM